MGYAAHGPKGPNPPKSSWERWMDMALAQAHLCLRLGEVPVGALILDTCGKVLACAGNRVESSNDPAAHAEILALRQAGAYLGNHRLGGCVLVCTLEPCLMCAGAISHARLTGVVFGAADALAGAFVSRADYYDLPGASRKLWHLGGIRGEECAAILQSFFQSAARRPPFHP